MQEVREAYQIMRIHANDAGTRAVDVALIIPADGHREAESENEAEQCQGSGQDNGKRNVSSEEPDV
jgi:hypothetical protein